MGVDSFAKAFGVDAASSAANEAFRRRAFYAAGSVIPGTSGAFDFAAKAGALGGAEGVGALSGVGLAARVVGRALGPLAIALTAYELFNWYKSQNKAQPASQAPQVGINFTAGVPGKQYDVRFALRVPPGGNITSTNGGGVFNGPFTVTNARATEQSPGSAPNYDYYYTVTGILQGTTVSASYAWSAQFLSDSRDAGYVKTFEVGSNPQVSPPETPTAPAYQENRNAAEVAKDSLAKIAPGLPLVTPAGFIPKRSPQFNPIAPSPGAPNQTPGVEQVDPKTGISVRTNPGTGAIEIYDPATGKTTEIWVPPGVATKEEQRKQTTAIGVIPTSCPSPCPDVDLSEVLTKIAEVNAEVKEVQDSVGFKSATSAIVCGTSRSIPSVQKYLETIDDKIGLDEPLEVPEGTNGGNDVCSVGTALEALLTVVPTQVVFQGFEAKALRDAQLVIYFNTNIKVIKTRFQMSCPNPVAGLTKALIKAAFLQRIPGDWLVSLSTNAGTELAGWFASEAAGIAYLTQAATLTTNQYNPETAFTATHRPGKGPSVAPGTIIYPVVAFLYEGPGQSAYTSRIVLRD